MKIGRAACATLLVLCLLPLHGYSSPGREVSSGELQASEEIQNQIDEKAAELKALEEWIAADLGESKAGLSEAQLKAKHETFKENVAKHDSLRRELEALISKLPPPQITAQAAELNVPAERTSDLIPLMERKPLTQELDEAAKAVEQDVARFKNDTEGFARYVEAGIGRLRENTPMLRAIRDARSNEEFVNGVAQVADFMRKKVLKAEISEKMALRGEFAEALSAAVQANQDEFFILQGALTAKDSTMIANVEEIRNATEKMEQILRDKPSLKYKFKDNRRFAETRKYEFRNHLAQTVMFAQALALVSPSDSRRDVLEWALSRSSMEFMESTQGLLSFTSVSLAGFIKEISPQLKRLIPTSTYSVFVKGAEQAASATRLIEPPNMVKMLPMKDRVWRRTALIVVNALGWMSVNLMGLALSEMAHVQPVIALVAVNAVMVKAYSKFFKAIGRKVSYVRAEKVLQEQKPVLDLSVNMFSGLRCEALFW